MERKLTKSNDRRICGVCGGIAKYLDVDPTVMRLLTASAALFTGIVFVTFAYLIAAMIIPSNEI
jgi:phage shock protein PspC (stress-responsive transcriptional regulator)